MHSLHRELEPIHGRHEHVAMKSKNLLAARKREGKGGGRWRFTGEKQLQNVEVVGEGNVVAVDVALPIVPLALLFLKIACAIKPSPHAATPPLLEPPPHANTTCLLEATPSVAATPPAGCPLGFVKKSFGRVNKRHERPSGAIFPLGPRLG